MQSPHSKSIQTLYEKLNSSKNGLTQKQAESKLEKYGHNELKETHKINPIKILWEQVNSFLIYILLAATAIMLFFGSYLDAAVIFAIVIVNSLIGFFQQYRAEKAIANLKKLIRPISKVFRNGRIIEISSKEIVPGDIIVLTAGDKVTADARIISSKNLEVSEAVLTGESAPVSKLEGEIKEKIILAKRTNMLFAGTAVVKGEVRALVVETGMNTEFGNIAKTLQEIEDEETPMQKRLSKFSKQLGLIILCVVALLFVIGWLKGYDLFEMFFTSVTLAIGVIPEGLPAVLAIAFSIASVMLYKKNVIVRRLASVETLGSVSVICTDKTGTITEEKMTVKEFFFNDKYHLKEKIKMKKNKEFLSLLRTSIFSNDARYEIENKKYTYIGDPTETAYVKNALEFGVDKKILTEKFPTKDKIEFDSVRKMMSKIRSSGRGLIMYTKGASEQIVKNSSFELINGQIKKLTGRRKRELLEKASRMESKALRVLGFAYKNISSKTDTKESGLIFQGFIGMIDPPRKEVKDAIRACQSAGIKVKLITGDSLLTAKAIAAEVGITGEVISQEQLAKMSDEELDQRINDISIFARMTPKQKLRVAKMLQGKGEIVAMTGDGINDVLALKAADIGIAMGKRGTDVARDVSDLVLVDDNFASIVAGVEDGRVTYDNIKKFTKYMLSVNFSTLVLISIVSLLGMPLPITPILILWKNLLTDSIPALTLVLEKEKDVMKSKPRKEKSLLDGILKFILLAGFVNFLGQLIIYLFSFMKELPLPYIQTMVVTVGIYFELLFVYTCRNKKPLAEIGIFSNKWLNWAVLTAIGLHLILLYTPLSVIFNVVPLAFSDWLIVLPLALSGVVIFEVRKYFRKR